MKGPSNSQLLVGKLQGCLCGSFWALKLVVENRIFVHRYLHDLDDLRSIFSAYGPVSVEMLTRSAQGMQSNDQCKHPKNTPKYARYK